MVAFFYFRMSLFYNGGIVGLNNSKTEPYENRFIHCLPISALCVHRE